MSSSPKNVLFLCTGNTCRSPMAAALYAHLAPEDAAESAGLCALPGQPAAAHMQTLAAERGIDLSGHASRPLTPELLALADYVICLSAAHAMAVAALVPPEKLRVLGGGVADPYGGSLEDYRACAAQMQALLFDLVKDLHSPCWIVQTQEGHLPVLAALEQVAFSSPASEAKLREKLALSHAHMLTALLEDPASVEIIAGFIGVDEIAGEAFVDDVAIFPAYQHRGIGSALLARAETGAILRGCEKIHLEVRESNAAARALYVARNYTEVGRRRGFYERPQEDAILMTMEVR